jgi:soluble lytic murein transglycosylase-like protein
MTKIKISKQHAFLLGIFYAVSMALIGQTFISQSKTYFTDLFNPYKQAKPIEAVEPAAVEPEVIYSKDMSVQDKIVFYADMFGVDRQAALQIAECESGFNPNAENIEGSATGVFQFIRKTWKNNCAGDVYNPDHNIICFMQNYPEHKNWWECKAN